MNRKELIAIRLNLIQRHFHPDHKPVLVAVTKKQPIEDILYAYEAGVRDFGENRVEELEEKALAFQQKGYHDLRWHFIGNIQSKKISKLLKVPNLHSIHSISSWELLQKLVKRESDFNEASPGKELRLFLQINTSNEKEKGGIIEWDDLAASINLLLKREGAFKLFGLMTMSKLRTNHFEEDALKCFEQLKKIKESVIKDFDLADLKLSMGMSSDYEIALQVGTDYLRLGSVLFAPYDRD